MGISASKWHKISNNVYAKNHIITEGYSKMCYVTYHIGPSPDDNEIWKRVDLDDDEEDHVIDALKYSLSGIRGIKFNIDNIKVSAFDPSEIEDTVSLSKKECTCGTFKTYGKNVSISMHSSWCDLR